MNARPAILVVEDHPLNLKLVRSLLTLSGYRILEAENAQQAITLATTHRPALILMDIQLPDMDGLEATRILKSQEETKDIPVVALTAHAMPGDKGKAKEVGCVGYITKPIDTRNFIAILEGYLTPDIRKVLKEPGPETRERDRSKAVENQTEPLFDPLSSLPNKDYSRKHLDQELKRASRQGYSLSVLLLGLDDVQEPKTKGGPQEKDRLFKRLETALRASVREIDFVAPYDGDTFILILPYTHSKESLNIANRLAQVVKKIALTSEAKHPVTFDLRIGIADNQAKGFTAKDLLDQAESALRQAQKEQKNWVKVFGDP